MTGIGKADQKSWDKAFFAAANVRCVTVSRRILDPGGAIEEMAGSRGLYRSRRHRIIAGVAGGMAERFGLPVWFVRFVWLLLLLPGGLPGLVPYLVCWVLIPAE